MKASAEDPESSELENEAHQQTQGWLDSTAQHSIVT